MVSTTCYFKVSRDLADYDIPLFFPRHVPMSSPQTASTAGDARYNILFIIISAALYSTSHYDGFYSELHSTVKPEVDEVRYLRETPCLSR